jgi:RimJ/RimL family protein N-acetyltransferase
MVRHAHHERTTIVGANEVRIRLARIEDASALCAAEIETAKTPGLLRSRPYELRVESFAQRIAELNAPGNKGRYIVAVAANDASDSPMAHALLDPMALANNAHIFRLTIVVHPGHTTRGVGRMLMNDLMQWASHDTRVEKIELLVRATNERAIRLYRSCGFIEEGSIARCLRLQNGTYIDDLMMAWFPAKN